MRRAISSRRCVRRSVLSLLACGAAVLLSVTVPFTGSAVGADPIAEKKADTPAPPKWEAAIAAFEAKDKESPPPKDAVLFLGSSSIRLWDLPRAFPDQATINRGFGGSQIADSVQYVDRLVIPHRPRLVVFYAGDNDIAAKKTPQQVLADFKQLAERIHAKLPECRIAFIAVKPSLSRWKLFETQKEANHLVAEYIKTDRRLTYVDVVPKMLGNDGLPRAELFVKDGLHLSPSGYHVWNDLVAPLLAPVK